MYSPLEQFIIINLFSVHDIIVDFSVTNVSIIIILCIFVLSVVILSLFTLGRFNVPNRWQFLFEGIYSMCIELIYDVLGIKGEKFFPFLFSTFLVILSLNSLGLIPYSFTITSQLASTLVFAYMIFIGVLIVGVQSHGFNLMSMFLPAGTSLFLSFLLIPVELLSYFFKPVSLGVRLFANLMAGHTLLKVIIGFSWAMLGIGGIYLIIYLIPLGAIVSLFVLETAVSIIQSYVFTILTTIYLNDMISLSH
uniref:ATP synthase subunit a n=1 Tax=Protohalopteris sp. TaxID=2843287 RepID=A0A8F0FD23_9PHAE|nr:ATPase subunit 6 [Protohalopteris sp.]